jgi:hypothetical protein
MITIFNKNMTFSLKVNHCSLFPTIIHNRLPSEYFESLIRV